MESSTLSKEKAFLATVAYADVFSYPLTRGEILEWSLFYPISKFTLPKNIEEHDGFVFAKGRRRIVTERLAKEAWQEEKWRIAGRAAGWLARIPTMKLIGVTGGLAMNNADRRDDIDLFCVVENGSLWVSRFLATVLMDILGLRRHPKDTQVANKVCLNMFVAESGLCLLSEEQDCFAAHEVLQMQPLWQEKGMYKKFLRANAWVRKFLPNAWKKRIKIKEVGIKNKNRIVGIWVFKILEWPAKVVQLWYMRGHRTNEVITGVVLRFHPKDARVWIKRKLGVRLAKYNIPLDKVFWAN